MAEAVEVDENLDLQTLVEQFGFTEYDKIADAIQSDEVTLNDILACNEAEIKAILAEYGVKTVQRIRFVQAIKSLPNSQLNAVATSPKKCKDNAEEEKDAVERTEPSNKFLSELERQMIDEFSKTSDKLTNYIISFEKIKKSNNVKIDEAKAKLTQEYNRAIMELTNMGMEEEKTIENHVNKLKEYQVECNKLRASYEKFIISKDKENVDKHISMEQNIQKWRNDVEKIDFTFASFDFDMTEIKVVTPPVYRAPECYNFAGKRLGLSVCGLPDKIVNDGKTFHTSYDNCLARTNVNMVANSGVYKILWKIETLEYPNGLNCIGICTDYYKNGSDQSKNWVETNYYIGWCNCDREHVPNHLLSGWSNKDSNLFYKGCKFVGDSSLPKFSLNDVVGLIYDSNENILMFELNGKLLNSKLTNIPKNENLFWCVGHWDGEVKFTMITES